MDTPPFSPVYRNTPAADAAGESLNGYIVGAVKQRMERESAGEVDE